MARLIFIVFCILLQSSFTQNINFIQKSDHIPLGLMNWGGHANYNYGMISDTMGAELIIVDGLNNSVYEKIKQTAPNLKLIPYTTGSDTSLDIAKYSEGMYNVWRATGDQNPGSKIYMKYNSSLCESVFDNDIGENVIKTLDAAEAGKILFGPGADTCNGMVFAPGYSQPIEFRLPNPEVIQYNILYKMKIGINPIYEDEVPKISEDTNTVCTLKIVYKNNNESSYNTFASKKIRVSDFGSYDQWKDDFDIGNYSLNTLQTEAISILSGKDTSALIPYVKHIEFWIEWSGLPYINLFVDRLTCFDLSRGYALMHNQYPQQIVAKITQNQPPYQYYPTDSYDSTVISWYAIDEPRWVDNIMVINKIDSIMNSSSSGKRRLQVVFAGCFNGTLGGGGCLPHEVYSYTEFLSRSDLNFPTLQFLLFEYPYQSTISTIQSYREQGICNTENLKHLQVNLQQFSTWDNQNQYSRPFGMMMQTGKWKNILYKTPTSAQFLYNANLGLLFGVKLLLLNNYFYIGDSTTSLCKMDNPQNPEYQPLWFTIKDTLSPRLKGLFGKALRKFKSSQQIMDIDLNATGYSDDWIDSIKAGTTSNTIVDIGLFADSSNAYRKNLMLVNRWYNSTASDKFKIKFETYKNWVVFDYLDSVYRSTLIDSDANAYINDTIPVGDCKLYSIHPVVKYGGEINHDETLTSETLTENDLTINSGKTLTIMGTYDCYKNIIVNSGGTLDIKPGSTLNFHNGSKIIVNGLFTANGISDTLININFQSVSGNPVNGIFFGNNSSGSIDNCTIENGYYGVTASSCSLIIKNSEIRDCNIGIYMYNTSYYGNNTEINRCKIHDITYTGIDLNNSSPLIINNIISNCEEGISCENNSDAFLGDGNYYGYNSISNVETGIYSCSSDPLLGNYSQFPLYLDVAGYNSIVGDENHVVLELYCDILAQRNWWGTSEPKEGFLILDNGLIDYSDWLESSPFGESQTPEEGGEEILIKGKTGQIPLEGLTTRDKYRMALDSYLKRNKQTARVFCNSILDEEGENILKYSALRLLVRCVDEDSVKSNIISKINNTLLTTAQTDYNAYLEMTLADIVRSNYLTSLDGIMTKYRNTTYKPLILFRKFSYLYFEEENRDSARVIANIMEDLYPEHELTKSAKMMFGMTTLKKETEETSIIPKEYKLYQNYPNPFNPVTTIKYQLPANSKVTLTIYDILGKEVTKLVDKEQEAGKYQITFDAKKYASGVYVYKMTAGEFMMSKKMILVK